MKNHLKILLIDDDEEEYLLLKSLTDQTRPESGEIQLEIHWVETFSSAVKAIESQDYDAYLVDYNLGTGNGIELMHEAHAADKKQPFILLTGFDSYDIDIAAMQAGAADYLIKGEINAHLLERSIRYALERKQAEEELEKRVAERTKELSKANQDLRREIAERLAAQEAQKHSEERFRKLAETTSAAILIIQEQKIRYANPAAKLITGYEPADLASKRFWELAHPSYQEVARQRRVGLQWIPGIPARYELKLIRSDGQERWVDITEGEIEFEGKQALLLTAFDITERDMAEKELRKAKAELEVRVAERTIELQQANDQLEESNLQVASINEKLANANQRLLNDLEERERLLDEIQRAAEESRYRLSELNAVFISIAEAVVVYNASGVAIQANPMAVEVLGQNPVGQTVNDLAGHFAFRQADNLDGSHSDSPAARALRGEIVRGQPYMFTHPDGRSLTLLVSASPLYSKGEVIGAVSIWHDITERQNLLEQVQTNAARSEILVTLSQALAEVELDYQGVLNTISRRMAELYGDACVIRLVSEDGLWLDPVAYYHSDAVILDSLNKGFAASRLPIDRDWAGELLRTRAPVFLPDISHGKRSARQSGRQRSGQIPPEYEHLAKVAALQSALVVPMITHGRVIGTLGLLRLSPTPSYSQDDISFLGLVSERASLAIENARLHAEVVQMANTDPLTGLYNRRGLLELGKREIERAHRFKRSLSLILLDIDRFKQVNDTFGHAAGDQVLRVLARRCSEHIRMVDILGRYGGEEFVVLLPETSLSTAKEVAERIRRSMSDKPVQTDQGQVKMSISLGVASAGNNASDLAEILSQADAALYRAKENGRNRVEIS